jgi:tyramine---L-glutamate ligase
MRILVYEWVSAGGLTGARVPEALRRDGEAMAAALADDLTRVPGWVVATVRGADAAPPRGDVETHLVSSARESLDRYRELCGRVDAVWPTAPETDGLLGALIDIARARAELVVACDPDTARTCASKRATSVVLRSAGIPTVPTLPAGEAPTGGGAWVVKPDDGAGCEETWLCGDAPTARRHLATHPTHVAQPWIEGRAMSLSVIAGDGRASVLACNEQRIDVRDGALHLAGVDIAVPRPAGVDFDALAADVARALPGLRGYVGIDLVLAADGPHVIEINPRLTLSYCGLSDALGINVAAAALRAAGGVVPSTTPAHRAAQRSARGIRA